MKSFFNLFVLTFFSYSVSAQLITNSDVPISITSGTTVTVNGGITSNGTTTINNNGTITLTGDFTNNTNNNLFGISNGTVSLIGAGQNINGISVTAFNNLILGGTGNKTLQADIITGGAYSSPAGILELNDKTLLLNSKLLTINNNSPFAITRTTGFIQSETSPLLGYGRIKWHIGNSNSGLNYIFPFGTTFGPSYIPFELNITTPGNGSNGNFTINTYPTNSTNTPLPTGVSSVVNFNGQNNADFVLDRFWIIEPADYVSLPVSNLTFTYRDNEHTQSTNSISESLLQMQFSDGNIWSPTPAGTVNTTTNTILVNNVSNYAFAWTAVDNSSPLPIELLYFTAVAVDNNFVLCKWSTATEINNDHFIVQRSRDAINFEDAGIVAGAGNSNSVINYKLTDDKPYKGISYYRLKQVDFDGSYSYSGIVPVNITDEEILDIKIFPNPTKGKLFLLINQNIKNISLTDLTGRVISEFELGNNYTELDISHFSSGVYFLITEKNKFKIIKQ